MKILHLIDSSGLYGAEHVVLTLMRGLAALGHVPVLGSLRLAGEPVKAIEAEARRCGIDVWPVEANRGLDYAAMRRLGELCARNGIAVIHTHGYKANILAALFFGRRGDLPIVTTLHGWTGSTPLRRVWWYELIERPLLVRFDAVVAVHHRMAMVNRIPRSAVRRLKVIENGIPEDLPVPEHVTGSASLELAAFCAKKPTIGVVGRLSAEKAVDAAIHALRMLVDRGLDVQLAIVGTGPKLAVCEELAAHLRLSDRVRFAGYIADAGKWLRSFSVLAMPSLQEGMPIILLEGMRAAVPIVATSVGAIPDLLDGGACGILVPPSDVPALAEGIQRVLEDQEQAEARAEQARRRFSARYSATITVKNYVALYEELLSARSHLIGVQA